MLLTGQVMHYHECLKVTAASAAERRLNFGSLVPGFVLRT